MTAGVIRTFSLEAPCDDNVIHEGQLRAPARRYVRTQVLALAFNFANSVWVGTDSVLAAVLTFSGDVVRAHYPADDVRWGTFVHLIVGEGSAEHDAVAVVHPSRGNDPVTISVNVFRDDQGFTATTAYMDTAMPPWVDDLHTQARWTT
jgi:hypothetical protein